jgi:hypothetical protein
VKKLVDKWPLELKEVLLQNEIMVTNYLMI